MGNIANLRSRRAEGSCSGEISWLGSGWLCATSGPEAGEKRDLGNLGLWVETSCMNSRPRAESSALVSFSLSLPEGH